MPHIFISYAKSDRTHALDLAGELRAHGFSVWIDQGSIGGAKNWTTEIVEAIDACSTFLCLLSPHSLASQNVAKELHLASEKQKNILPVLLERVTLPSNFEYSLAGLQRVQYEDRPAILQALESLHGLPAAEALPPVTASLPADDSIHIAVLPFDDLSPDHDNQWFADGMMDELISTLGSLDRVKVPSRSDVLHYRDHRRKSREVSNELGVRYLIEGGVRKSKEKIRINASLTDTLKGEQLWSNKFDGTFEDVFAFQESVATNITAALKLKLSPQEEQQVEDHGTQNAEAYELYLKGRHEQYYVTKESYLRALELYEQAATLDPKFERAHIGAASICCFYYREYSKDPKWLNRAEATLAKIESIAGETARSLYIRGMIEWLKGDDVAAITTLTRSTELDPKYHNPFNVLGAIHMGNGNYPAAAEALQRVTELVETTMGYFNLLNAIAQTGDNERRIQVAEKSLPVFDRYLLREPEDHQSAVSRAFILLWAGKKEEAAEAAANLLARSELSGVSLYDLGCLFGDLDKPELFVSLFRKAIKNGYREIEQTRNLVNDITNPALRRELQLALDELEKVIQQESVEQSA
ncbi:MAG TPA: TIR domain-containing protein [Candidatus Kapabacteria bacterium]|nr:TIR domain-containing protein [Candidatus Kapabacteria bacterium]